MDENSTSFAELERAADVSQLPEEDTAEYSARLLKAVSKLSDAKWEGLSQDAQALYNQMVASKKAGSKKTGNTPAPADPTGGTEDVMTNGTKPKRSRGKKAAGETKNPTQAAAEAKAKKPRVRENKSALERARELLIESNMKDNLDTIIAKLEKEGYKPTKGNLGGIHSSTNQIIRFLNEQGHIKDPAALGL